MARTAGVLGSVYEPEDGSTRGNWRHKEQEQAEVAAVWGMWGTGRDGP